MLCRLIGRRVRRLFGIPYPRGLQAVWKNRAVANANPLLGVGALFAQRESKSELRGTCFLFRSDVIALTAAHCVAENLDEFAVLLPHVNPAKQMRVNRVERHPRADIAMLFCDGDDSRDDYGNPVLGFRDGFSNWQLGSEFNAYGYPMEGPAALRGPATATPRFFAGYFQRIFYHESHAGFRYLAGELNIPAPIGLSGGPVFMPGPGRGVFGVVADNVESQKVTDEFSETRWDGTHYKEKTARILTYGVAVMLSGVADWLNDLTPPSEKGTRGWTLMQYDPLAG